MDSTDEFDLKEAIEMWEESNFSQKELTPANTKEFKSHILDSIDELIEKDLSEEEAFAIAKLRFGDRKDWGEKMQRINEDNFHLKKVIMLFSGVFAFILSNSLVLCLNKLLIIGLNYYNGNAAANIETLKIFVNFVYFLSISSIIALYFLHEPMIWLLRKLKFKPIIIIPFVILLIVLVLLEWYLGPQVRKSIDDVTLSSMFLYIERNFRYLFLFIISVGYVVLIIKYNKKFNI